MKAHLTNLVSSLLLCAGTLLSGPAFAECIQLTGNWTGTCTGEGQTQTGTLSLSQKGCETLLFAAGNDPKEELIIGGRKTVIQVYPNGERKITSSQPLWNEDRSQLQLRHESTLFNGDPGDEDTRKMFHSSSTTVFSIENRKLKAVIYEGNTEDDLMEPKGTCTFQKQSERT